MSLATTGGGLGGAGGAGGGMMLAHDAGGVGRANIPPPTHGHADTGHGPSIPSGGVLGADLMDRQQSQLSLRNVKNVSHLPIVAVDLFASEVHIAYFPKKPDDPSETVPPRIVGKMKANVYLHGNNETAHKTLKKYLSQSKTFVSLQTDVLTKSDEKTVVVIEKPHHWLGLRRVQDAPEFLRHQQSNNNNNENNNNMTIEFDDSPAIAEETNTSAGVVVSNGTLDGSTPQMDDFDRVVFKLRLNPAKKAITMLPEEAVQILLHQAQYHVAAKVLSNMQEVKTNEEIVEYPLAVAIPAWALHDASVEALYDSTGTTPGVFFQRSICALAGALLPASSGKPNTLLERLEKVRTAMMKEHRRQLVQEPDLVFHDDVLIVLLGMTDEGFEATAIQISDFQGTLATCLFTKFKVISNVSYQAMNDDPLSKMEQCIKELYENIEAVAPEADGPGAILTYGMVSEQEKMKDNWNNHIKKQKGVADDWAGVPLLATKSDAVCMGTAIMGAVSHGRQALLVEKQGGKTKAELGIQVQNVAPAAVGYRIHYFGGNDESLWTPVKEIFEFDRRIPAGPYSIELKASECVIHREQGKLNGKANSDLPDEDFLKAAKEKESAKHIPAREEAAFDLRLEIVQKWTRDGDWKRVGEVKDPLVLDFDGDEEADSDIKEGDEKQQNRTACESVTLEISIGVTGMLTLNMIGDRQSVVQATQSARKNAIQWYIGVGLAILFFGGFLIRSYWEEYTFNRDTKKLLAYYHHVVPGSISDGDEHNARYIVWRFRHKKHKLWGNLERKYGVAVRDAHEWEDYKADENTNAGGSDKADTFDDDEVDLDEDIPAASKEEEENNKKGVPKEEKKKENKADANARKVKESEPTKTASKENASVKESETESRHKARNDESEGNDKRDEQRNDKNSDKKNTLNNEESQGQKKRKDSKKVPVTSDDENAVEPGSKSNSRTEQAGDENTSEDDPTEAAASDNSAAKEEL